MTQRTRRLGKTAVVVVLLVVIVWVLFAWAFPWVDRQLNDPVLDVAVPVGAIAGRLRAAGASGGRRRWTVGWPSRRMRRSGACG